jgi:hypothetical protein
MEEGYSKKRRSVEGMDRTVDNAGSSIEKEEKNSKKEVDDINHEFPLT